MEGSSVSGAVRIVHGVPLKLQPNRLDVSWAPEYHVVAAACFEDSPNARCDDFVDSPWEPIGSLTQVGSPHAVWHVTYGPPPHGLACISRAQTFSDGLYELADHYRALRTEGTWAAEDEPA
jgi:hypothetical protein